MTTLSIYDIVKDNRDCHRWQSRVYLLSEPGEVLATSPGIINFRLPLVAITETMMTLNNKSVADGFDFLLGGEDAAKAQPLVPSEMSSGPNLAKVTKMTSRKFAQTVLDVFDSLGGASWLLIQAQVDPKGFLELLKKMIPNSVQMGDLQGLTVRLIDQFGNEVHIDARG